MKYKPSRYNHFGKLSNGSTLLYNLVSSSVAIVGERELEIINSADFSADAELCGVAAAQGFIVPYDEDEVAKLLTLRHANNFSSKRAGFQILPTTACNARCFYCYEQGYATQTMSEDTARAAVDFILDYCEGMDELDITWFGGEPLIGQDTIEFISHSLIPELDRRGTRYMANMITNGALISESNVNKLAGDWRISEIQITLDGKGDEYLRRKAYVDSGIRYEHILNNIALLTKRGVKVLVRLNVDRRNLASILGVIEDLSALEADMNMLWPYAAPLYSDKENDFCLTEGELNGTFEIVLKKLIDCGFIKTINGLPMNFSNAVCCAKMLNNFVIAPNGEVSKCEHLLNIPEEVVGSVYSGIRFNSAMVKWCSTDVPQECLDCVYLPICQAGCMASAQRKFAYGRCSYIAFISNAVVTAADYLLTKGGM